MWRIYSNSKKINDVAIRVKTTAKKLFDSIYTVNVFVNNFISTVYGLKGRKVMARIL